MRARNARDAGAVRGFRISGAAAPAPVVAGLMQYGILPQSGYGHDGNLLASIHAAQ